MRRTWIPSGHVRLGAAGLVLNALAVGWLTFATVDIAWPRASIAPPDAPWYHVWAAPFVLALIAVGGGLYLLVGRPLDRMVGKA
jgi:hypothetical protein